jgi:hypothetical protein
MVLAGLLGVPDGAGGVGGHHAPGHGRCDVGVHGALRDGAAWTLLALLVTALAIGGGIAAWSAVQRNRVASLRQKDGHYRCSA